LAAPILRSSGGGIGLCFLLLVLVLLEFKLFESALLVLVVSGGDGWLGEAAVIVRLVPTWEGFEDDPFESHEVDSINGGDGLVLDPDGEVFAEDEEKW